MRTNSKEDERRKAERRSSTKSAAAGGERRTANQRVGVAAAMVDALEDILKWERASERVIRVAQADSSTDLHQN